MCFILLADVKPIAKVKASATELVEGDAITLSCNATGSPTPAIRWMKEGDILKRCSIQCNLIYDAVNYEKHNGDFICEAENYIGKSSVSVTINVKGK